MSRADRIRTKEAIEKAKEANRAAWADPVQKSMRVQNRKNNTKPKENTQGRAVGAVGPGDVRKLAEKGLTVVDTKAYERLLERLRLADDVAKHARRHTSYDGALDQALQAFERGRQQ